MRPSLEIVIGEDGRMISPVGVTLRIPVTQVVRESKESDEERRARLHRFFRETEEALRDMPVREICSCGHNPLVAKYQRIDFFDEEPRVE